MHSFGQNLRWRGRFNSDVDEDDGDVGGDDDGLLHLIHSLRPQSPCPTSLGGFLFAA